MGSVFNGRAAGDGGKGAGAGEGLGTCGMKMCGVVGRDSGNFRNFPFRSMRGMSAPDAASQSNLTGQWNTSFRAFCVMVALAAMFVIVEVIDQTPLASTTVYREHLGRHMRYKWN